MLELLIVTIFKEERFLSFLTEMNCFQRRFCKLYTEVRWYDLGVPADRSETN